MAHIHMHTTQLKGAPHIHPQHRFFGAATGHSPAIRISCFYFNQTMCCILQIRRHYCSEKMRTYGRRRQLEECPPVICGIASSAQPHPTTPTTVRFPFALSYIEMMRNLFD